MSLFEESSQLHNAKIMRSNMTAQERHLWYDFLRHYPVKIFKQKILGPYIVDFYCFSTRLVIELDGSQHYEEAGVEYDAIRTKYLHSLGLAVLRYSNLDIDLHFEAVCRSIDQAIRSRLTDADT